jgi:hypothetical protein
VKAAENGGIISFVHIITQIFLIEYIISLTDAKVITDVRRITGEKEDSDYIPKDPRELAK